MKLLICNNTTHNFLWEPEKIKFKFHRNSENTDKFVMPKISFCEIWSFWSLFSRAPTRSFSLKLFHITYYIISTRQKCKKEWNMLEIILVQSFCLALKIKMTQFPNGIRFKVWPFGLPYTVLTSQGRIFHTSNMTEMSQAVMPWKVDKHKLKLFTASI